MLSQVSDESTEHSQSGRQALAFTGRRSVVAVAVVRRGALFSSHHVSSAVLGGVGFTRAVSSVVAVVAVHRLALLAYHRLAVGVAPVAGSYAKRIANAANAC